MISTRRAFLTALGAAFAITASGASCKPYRRAAKEGSTVKPDSDPLREQRRKGMTPDELRRQILGAPVSNIEYDYRGIRSFSRER